MRIFGSPAEVVDGGAFAIWHVVANVPGTGAVECKIAWVETELDGTGHVARIFEAVALLLFV